VTVKAWHLVLVGGLAIAALSSLLTFVVVGRGANNTTKTVAVVAAAMPEEAAQRTAAANVRASIPAVEAFYADNNTYAGMTMRSLRELDPGLDPTVSIGWAEGDGYCVESTVDGQTASDSGPVGSIAYGGC
jgi:hypothetical protein